MSLISQFVDFFKTIMKGLTVILLMAAVTLAAAAIPVCPVPEEGGDVVLFPNPDDCSTFWECDELTPVLLHCPPGLWFNPAENVCDYPENVVEGICVPPSSIPTTIPPQKTTPPPAPPTTPPPASPTEP